WITPARDMSVFFCYVYLIVDCVIQLSGIASIYATFFYRWEYLSWIMTGLLAVMMALVLILVRPFRPQMYIPLLGIDWLGAALWTVVMLCFTFVCIYGNFYDWWEAREICGATFLGLACLCLNLWRASFLHHPYISFTALTNSNVVRATTVYLVFFTLLATEHVFEHTYAGHILGYDDTNIIDLNWSVLVGILLGCGFTYATFARKKWRYKTMTAIAFCLAALYLAYFYFFIDYAVEKEMLFIPLCLRGAASVMISIVFLTSIKESGLNFFTDFPKALTVNGFTGAVMGATVGPAIVGEWFNHAIAKNMSLLGSVVTGTNPDVAHVALPGLMNMFQQQAMIVSMKEIFGWLLIAALVSLVLVCVVHDRERS
ncbi:MAG: hypothetical protein K2M12_04510, partial [Muribaculaceae bacterium]|nr:hypothetical protein [Muribaculaceae bacterium]